MVDEDCGDLKYCLYGIENSKCLPCIPTDMVCIQSVLSFVDMSLLKSLLKTRLISIFYFNDYV